MKKGTEYQRFTGPRDLEKSINSLLGLVEGIAIDAKINSSEVDFLQLWVDDHRIKADRHPFSELFPVVEQAIEDGVITEEEREDIKYLCNKLLAADYYDFATADMQKLHAVLAGVASDGEISEEELRGLSAWAREHEHLKGCWPYDEVESLITGVLADGRIDPEEHKLLMSFFGEFVSILDSKTIANPMAMIAGKVGGVCAVCPEIIFEDRVFCFTGESYKYSRKKFYEVVTGFGGRSVNTISGAVTYLVIGAEGNSNWAFACYGRKVEQAMQLRKEGHPIIIVHENDFHDAVQDM